LKENDDLNAGGQTQPVLSIIKEVCVWL